MSFFYLSISVLKVGRQLAGLLAVAAFFSSCFKEETPIEPHLPGNVTTASVNLGSDYRHQVFFSLEHDSVVSSQLKYDWDLSFDAALGEQTIYLNSAKLMFAADFLSNVNSGKVDTTGYYLMRRWDASNTPDSIAIGNKFKARDTYILDLGFDQTGLPIGFKTLKILAADDQKYSIQYANLDGSDLRQADILKDSSYNRVYFSFKTNQQVTIEPHKHDWDIVFTQYIHTFYTPYIPYLVTGAIINPNKTTTAADSSGIFNKINLSFTSSLNFTSAPEGIGFTWKAYGGTDYTVKPYITYVIKDSKSVYYKLHFIDFYNKQGVKGNPTFEYQRL